MSKPLKILVTLSAILFMGCQISKSPTFATDPQQDDSLDNIEDSSTRSDRQPITSDGNEGGSDPTTPDASCLEQCGMDAFCNLISQSCVPMDIEWVEIQGGEFEIGLSDGDSWETPQAHSVEMPSFLIGRTEVTVAQYEKCVSAGDCTAPSSGGPYENWELPDRDNHPINSLSWKQAREYCEFIGAKLPSEAQWEYAARSGGSDVVYPWGDESATCEHAVMSETPTEHGCNKFSTWEVCSKPAGHTDNGLCDMAGNVWEWVEDDFHSTYQNLPEDGKPWVDNERGSSVVKRGGSFASSSVTMQVFFRSIDDKENKSFGNGFRCIK